MIIRQRRKKKLVNKLAKEIADELFLSSPSIDELAKKNSYSLMTTGISQSLLTNWTCRVKFLIATNGYRLSGTGRNTYYGSIVHYVLENVYQPGKKRFPRFNKIDKWIDEYISKHKMDLLVWTDNKLEWAAGMVSIVLKNYIKYYSSVPHDFQDMKILESEKVFSVPFHNTILKGKKDVKFCYFTDENEKWIMEHKTMGTVNEKVLLKRLPIDKQNLFYVTADEYENNEPITGVLYNIIRRPMLKYNDKKETVKGFLKRLNDDIYSRPEFYYIRYPITYSREDIENFKKNLCLKLDDIHRFTSSKESMVYRNEDSCESAYNGAPYVCEYIHNCAINHLMGLTKQETLFPELEE